MTSLPGGHAVFLAFALATHALVGLTVGALLADRPFAGAIGGLLADADFLIPPALGWPLVHRGLTHTLLFAVLVTALLLYRHRAVGIAFGGAYSTQLGIDLTTAQGIPLLYPFGLASTRVQLPIAGHSAEATVLLWSLCLVGLYAADTVAPGRFSVPEIE